MFYVGIDQRIAKCFLLSLLGFDLVLSATLETGYRPEDHSGDENILRHDFFRFTTRARYVWEDWTVPTREPRREESLDPVFVMYFVIPVAVCVSVGLFVYLSIRYMCKKDCCSDEPDSVSSMSSDRFTTVHRPPQRANFSTQAHRPPAGRFGQLDSNGGGVSFINSTYSDSSQSGRGAPADSGTTVAEKPPDYSTVALNDLVSPTTPAFPAVKTNRETPPPEYGKQNSFFK